MGENIYILLVIVIVLLLSIAIVVWVIAYQLPGYLRHREAQTLLLKELALSSGVSKEKVDEIVKHL
jgi:hypothetical protein